MTQPHVGRQATCMTAGHLPSHIHVNLPVVGPQNGVSYLRNQRDYFGSLDQPILIRFPWFGISTRQRRSCKTPHRIAGIEESAVGCWISSTLPASTQPLEIESRLSCYVHSAVGGITFREELIGRSSPSTGPAGTKMPRRACPTCPV